MLVLTKASPSNAIDLHGSFCALEELTETANVDMASYGILVSPLTKKELLHNTFNGDVDERKAESFAQRLADTFVARMRDAEIPRFFGQPWLD